MDKLHPLLTSLKLSDDENKRIKKEDDAGIFIGNFSNLAWSHIQWHHCSQAGFEEHLIGRTDYVLFVNFVVSCTREWEQHFTAGNLKAQHRLCCKVTQVTSARWDVRSPQNTASIVSSRKMSRKLHFGLEISGRRGVRQSEITSWTPISHWTPGTAGQGRGQQNWQRKPSGLSKHTSKILLQSLLRSFVPADESVDLDLTAGSSRVMGGVAGATPSLLTRAP